MFPVPFNTGALPARRLPSCLDSPVEAAVFIAWGRAVPACCAKPTRGLLLPGRNGDASHMLEEERRRRKAKQTTGRP